MTLAELETGKAVSLSEIAAAKDAAEVEALRVKYVGRNGSIPALIKAMKDVPKEERPAFGKAVQAWKAEVEAALAAKADAAPAAKKFEGDLTLPGRWWGLGAKHPLSRVIEESAAIFGKLGFTVADGPELENRFTREHPGAFVVVMGCYAQLNPDTIAAFDGVDLVLGMEQKGDALRYIGKIQFAAQRAEGCL